jgi:hypothetical protein
MSSAGRAGLLEEQRDWVTETIPGVGTPNPLFGIEDRWI